MANVPDIKLIRTDITLDFDIWANLDRAEGKEPCPFLLSKIVCLLYMFGNTFEKQP